MNEEVIKAREGESKIRPLEKMFFPEPQPGAIVWAPCPGHGNNEPGHTGEIYIATLHGKEAKWQRSYIDLKKEEVPEQFGEEVFFARSGPVCKRCSPGFDLSSQIFLENLERQIAEYQPPELPTGTVIFVPCSGVGETRPKNHAGQLLTVKKKKGGNYFKKGKKWVSLKSAKERFCDRLLVSNSHSCCPKCSQDIESAP